MNKSKQTEKTIREYFESRPNWTVEKLDLGKNKAADFRISGDAICFLCEVKTVESVRASFPSTPLNYYLEDRKKKQDEIRKWIEQNPDKRLILRPDEREYIYGNEIEFEQKYRKRKRNTEKWFKTFEQKIKEYLSKSVVKDSPFDFRLDSDDLYVPNLDEQEKFFAWLVYEIQAIENKAPSKNWHVDKIRGSDTALYSVFYTIHIPSDKDDIAAKYQLTITGPRRAGGLDMHLLSYGGLNLDAITTNVERGLVQLKKSAWRESDPEIPRIIALAFESGIGFEQEELSSHIMWLLKSHSDLSAIAILEWVPDGTPPSHEQGFFAWAEFQAKTPKVPRFMVYHNSWLQSVKVLPLEAFEDKWSVQTPSIKNN
jgi:hypothetical protein